MDDGVAYFTTDVSYMCKVFKRLATGLGPYSQHLIFFVT
jgi:hypothetical protein